MCFRFHIFLNRLPELIGLSRALDVILTGRIIEAPEALQMGLVNRVCGTGTAYGRAMHLAKELQAHPQECLRADRASAYHATFASRSLEQSLEHEANEGLGIISRVSSGRISQILRMFVNYISN